jgi:cytochrome c peroxidase
MKTNIAIALMALLFFVCAINVQPLFTAPEKWPRPAYDFKKNPLTAEKIRLGRVLFYDPTLSRNNLISCASCHSPYNAFTHIDHTLSHGIDDRIGKRNSPALINLAWQNTFMWDGAVNHLDVQALAPITHPDEMGSSFDSVVKKLGNIKRYRHLYAQAFGDSAVTGERTLKSLSQFMLTLVSSNSKYDRVMSKVGDLSFTEKEQKGYNLFKTHCASCHTEPLFTSNNFENNGLQPDTILRDPGRIWISHRSSDSLKFKVPTLRNCELTAPYMHDGRYRNLQMVLFHYTNSVHHSPTLASQLRKKIELNEEEKGELIAFLKTLTDEEFVRNPSYSFLK